MVFPWSAKGDTCDKREDFDCLETFIFPIFSLSKLILPRKAIRQRLNMSFFQVPDRQGIHFHLHTMGNQGIIVTLCLQLAKLRQVADS